MAIIDMPNLPNISSPHQDSRVEGAPEKKVVNFAITMSILDLMAIVLGMLKLYLVLQKTGLEAMVKSIAVLTLILEVFRILCRSRGLELNLMHYMKQLPLSIRIISWPFYWIHLFSVLIFAVVSAEQLASHYFGKTEEASMFFYVVAILEAMVFLIALAIWIWKVNCCRLFEKVKDECGLDMDSINKFYYDVHYKCVTGNIFYSRKMDLVTFAQEFLFSSLGEEQLMGARIFKALSTNQHLSDDTLRKVGTLTGTIERLILMLNWRKTSDFQEEIRYLAAVIVSELVDTEQNAMRVVAIPGAMQSISSLLYSSSTSEGHKYNPLEFHLLGLSILMKLAKEHENCTKICNTHGLLSQILDFTSICGGIDQEAIIKSLQVVNMLAGMTGKTRRKISEVVFTGNNIRDILRHGEPHLQMLALEVLTNLAMNGKARRRIGRSGETVEELFKLFFQSGMTDDQNMLRKEAGKTLAMLILQNKANCSRILKQERIVERLMEAVGDPVISVSSSRILQKLCAFAGPNWSTQLSSVVACFTPVLNSIMENNQGVELLEVSLGLAAQMLKFMSPHKLAEELRRSRISDDGLVKRLVAILPVYRNPTLEVPQIRRFAIELTVKMMTIDKTKYVKLFKDAGIGRELRLISETRSEIEYFHFYSGRVRLSKHKVSLDSLLDEAFNLLNSP